MSESKTRSYQLFKQNSELEVLISAAIVFTAFVINDVAGDWIIDALNNNISGNSPVLFISAIAGLYMSSMLPISIISHFVLRIYWLSLVGLRSVYPQKKAEDVNPKFERIINSSLDLDRRIETVDKLCSSIFAFTFLTLFAFCFSFISITFITTSINLIDDPSGVLETFANLLVLFALIYMIDFLTLGWFKKIKAKWFATAYYPIYRFFGWITLAFLYRGIYYSLIEHASRKIMILITPVYMILAIIVMNLGYNANSIYPNIDRAIMKGEVAAQSLYRDEFPDKMILRNPFLDSFIVNEETDGLRVYFSLNQDLEDNILDVCEGVDRYYKRGLHWRKWIQLDFNRLKYDSTFNYQENAAKILDCVSSNVTFSLDDVPLETDQKFYFTRLRKPEHAALFTMLDISKLERGDHLLKIESTEDFKSKTFYIPFWRD